MKYRWEIKKAASEEIVKQLSKEINVNPVIAGLLAQRGINNFDEAKHFFRPNIEDLHDPFLMKDMDKAVDRITNAIGNDEKIMIYGDYDVDGTTSVAMFYSFLASVYPNCVYYIPDRYKEGYGVSTQGIDHAISLGVSLIISLDCGIRSIDKVTYAKNNNIDFIICDHHLPGEELPPAFACLDPKRKDCIYPYKELCGCGVGFKLLQAFCRSNSIDETKLMHYLDLVAVAICSDIVPITGENRILCYHGLQKLNTNPLPGIKALIQVSGYKSTLNVTNVVFGLGPRINAAGRIRHATFALDVLMATSETEALACAKVLNVSNEDRREVDSEITQEALAIIEDDEWLRNAKSTVLYKQDWHKGVIGIVASRCTEKYYRPTIILTESNGKLAGSARSVDGFDVHEAIASCADLLEQFGGHMYAAGLTMPIENFDAFRLRFEEVVQQTIEPEQLIPKQHIDIELQDMSLITPKFLSIIEQMGPFGPLNMQPVFVTKGLCDTGGSRILKDIHLRLSVKQANQATIYQAIAFGMAEEHYEHISSGKPFDLCYTIEENEYRGYKSIQLMVKDIRY